MITNFIITFFVLLLGFIFQFLGVLTIATIPYIGPSVIAVLYTMIGIWNAFMGTFPYALTGWHIFLIVIVPFEILLLIAKFFLGHHVPAHH